MIKVLKSSFIAALGLFLAAAASVQAQIPNGPLSFSFDANTAPLYDISGDYVINDTISGSAGDVPISIGINLVQDNRGQITGSGINLMTLGNDSVAANWLVKGRISGGGGSTRVTLTLLVAGEDVITGIATPFSIKISYKLQVSPGDGSLFGTGRGSANLRRIGNGHIRSDVAFPLPANVTGEWTLNMNIIPLSKLGGSADIVLSNGRVLQTKLAGSYSLEKGVGKVHLSGLNSLAPASFSITFVNDLEGGFVLERISGSAYGQKVKF